MTDVPSLTFYLRDGQDDALIRRLKAERNASALIRAALYAYLEEREKSMLERKVDKVLSLLESGVVMKAKDTPEGNEVDDTGLGEMLSTFL